jgi:hypothetical protein
MHQASCVMPDASRWSAPLMHQASRSHLMPDARDSFQFKCKQGAGQRVQSSILSGSRKKNPEICLRYQQIVFPNLAPDNSFLLLGGCCISFGIWHTEKKIQTQKASEFARQTYGKREKQLLMFSWSSLARSV